MNEFEAKQKVARLAPSSGRIILLFIMSSLRKIERAMIWLKKPNYSKESQTSGGERAGNWEISPSENLISAARTIGAECQFRQKSGNFTGSRGANKITT